MLASQEPFNIPIIINEIITVSQNNLLSEQQQPQDSILSKQQQDDLSTTKTDNTAPETTTDPITSNSEFLGISPNNILSCIPLIWLIGAIVFITWQGIKLVKFKRKIIRTSLEIEDIKKLSVFETSMSEMKIKRKLNLFSNNIIKTPMLIGLFKTYLILPEVDINDRELSVILKHEFIHFKRHDLWIKSLTLVANALHWFNPFSYQLTKKINTFCELSCDEKVVANMNMEERQFYGETILNVLCRVVNQHSGVYATLVESKKGIKERLIHMMSVKKAKKRIILISIAIALLLCLVGCAVTSALNMTSNSADDIDIFESNQLSDENTNEEHDDLVIDSTIGQLTAVIMPYNVQTDDEYSNIWELSVTLENGDILTKIYDYYDYYVKDPELYFVDLTQDGSDEIILVMPNHTSNYNSTNIHILSINNGDLTEILTILDSPWSLGEYSYLETTFKDSLLIIPHIAENEDLPMYTPLNYEYFCTGVVFVQTEDGFELWVRHLMKDSIPYSVIRWDGNGWYVADQGIHLSPEYQSSEKLYTEPWMESFITVLQNNTKFYCTDDQTSILLNQYSITSEYTTGIQEFTVIDLEHDNIPEVILSVTINDDEYGSLILHYEDGIVYGHTLWMRAFMEVKTDGTFRASSGAGDWGFNIITFDKNTYDIDKFTFCESFLTSAGNPGELYYVEHQSVFEDEFWSAVDQQDKKEDAIYYHFTNDNITAVLTSFISLHD